MDKYDCKNCVHNGKGSVFNRNKKCRHCVVDSNYLKGKPSCFKAKERNHD